MTDAAAIQRDPKIIATYENLRDVVERTIGRGVFKVTNAQENDAAVADLVRIRSARKQIEDRRLFYTKPMNDIIRGLNGHAKDLDAPYIKAEAALDTAILAYRRDLERTRLEEERRLQQIEDDRRAAEKKAGKRVLPKAPVAVQPYVPQTVKAEAGGGVTAKRIPDRKAIDADAKASVHARQQNGNMVYVHPIGAIPGVRIWLETKWEITDAAALMSHHMKETLAVSTR